MPRRCVAVCAAIAAMLGLLASARADPVTVLFVGDSFTHGRYDPVRNYGSGFGTGRGNVHDDNCLSAATCSPAEAVANPPPAIGTNEYGPFGGIPGIFLELTREANLDDDVSINAVSATSLASTAADPARVAAIETDPLTGRPFDTVVLQEQSFRPLPSVNALGRATGGNAPRFVSGVDRLVGDILAADRAAGQKPASLYLYETQPLASYTYTSPLIRGRGVRQPYVGAPIEAMAADLHAAYASAAAQNPAITGVAYAGDAWIRAIEDGVAQRNPYRPDEPAGQVDLWDSDVDAACCTTPIGYHPSTYGAYLSALVLFDRITGIDPRRFGGTERAAGALGIDPAVAAALEAEAAATVEGTAVPEPASFPVLALALTTVAGLRARRAGERRSRPGVARSAQATPSHGQEPDLIPLQHGAGEFAAAHRAGVDADPVGAHLRLR
jgi:hypothetical protein